MCGRTRRPIHSLGRASALVELVVLLFVFGGCSPESKPQRPNVLLVVLDTTRADVVSSYRNGVRVTPHLDQLAAGGARFTHAFTTDFWTLPTHASLLTGLYPSHHGALATTLRLSNEVETLAERLAAAGYHTAAFVTNPWLSSKRGFGQGFETYAEHWRQQPVAGARHIGEQGAVEAAETWIAERAAEEEPFFAFLNLNTPHLPYAPDPAVHVKLAPRPRSIERLARLKKVHGYFPHFVGVEHFDEIDFEILRELYVAEVAMVDSLVGRLIEALRSLDIFDQTLVVVSADHGENIGDHGKIDHLLSMYDTTIRVPLIMRLPARITPGRVDDGLTSLVDVFPTILDAVGLADAALSARSLLSESRPVPEFVIAENERPIQGLAVLAEQFPDYDASSIDGRLRMLRTARYKLIWHEKTGVELYDLAQDPEETRDVSDEQTEVRERLLSLLEEWMREHPLNDPVAPLESMDPEALRQLRALGYLE